MANLKAIRKRIASVKSTQKITRAQHRIQAIRPYAVKTAQVLAEVAGGGTEDEAAVSDSAHPLLARRAEKTVLLLVVTSDRGLCGAFNTNILRAATRIWKEREEAGQAVKIITIGRKGRDYFRRRNAPILEVLNGVWDRLDIEQARSIARTLLKPFVTGEVDSIYVVYNEFKSAMSQRVVAEPLFPLKKAEKSEAEKAAHGAQDAEWSSHREYLFEPNREALLERLVPMYIEVSILRALYESQASELGSRMTAMESATKKATEMIGKYTLIYNRARQAAITTELMEIISGAEALRE